jgi:hypothetical protein
MQARQFQCEDCGSQQGCRSRPRSISEKYIMPIFGLRPVRCADCFRRSYEWIFVEVHERHEPEVTHRAAA